MLGNYMHFTGFLCFFFQGRKYIRAKELRDSGAFLSTNTLSALEKEAQKPRKMHIVT